MIGELALGQNFTTISKADVLSICHVQAVSRLAFRPGKRDAVELASGSDDRSVRIFSIKMS